MTTTVIQEQPSTVVVDDGALSGGLVSEVITDNIGPPGPIGDPGADARVSFGFAVAGPYGSRAAILPAPITLSGSGTLDAASSHGQAWTPCTAPNVWKVTKNGTFASQLVADDAEIAAALFATVSFPAGAAGAVFAYPGGGAFADGDVLRVWESPTPDATQANTSLTFAGA